LEKKIDYLSESKRIINLKKILESI